ncbi:hypothetical protein CF326_g7987 [Tilletia indica]|nr:hypothetical protein CF326_g7987 [Tilletia indica]
MSGNEIRDGAWHPSTFEVARLSKIRDLVLKRAEDAKYIEGFPLKFANEQKKTVDLEQSKEGLHAAIEGREDTITNEQIKTANKKLQNGGLHAALNKAYEDIRALQVLANGVPELQKTLGKVRNQLIDSKNTSRKRRRGLDKITEIVGKVKNDEICEGSREYGLTPMSTSASAVKRPAGDSTGDRNVKPRTASTGIHITGCEAPTITIHTQINGDAAAPSPAQQAVSAIVVGLEADLDEERKQRQGLNRAYTELEKEFDAKDQDLFDARAEGASERMRADALAIAKDLSDKLLEEAQTIIMNLNSDVAEANTKADGAIDKADGAIKKAATLGSENIKLNDKLKIANRTISQAAKVSKALARVLADQLSGGKP